MATTSVFNIISDNIVPDSKKAGYELVELRRDSNDGMFQIHAIGDVIARIAVLAVRTDNIYVYDYETGEETQLTFRNVGDNLHVSDNTYGIERNGLKSTAHRAFALHYMLDHRNVPVKKTPFLTPIQFTNDVPEERKEVTSQITKHISKETHLPRENKRIHAISIVPKKKDGTPYLYRERANLNLQLYINAHGINIHHKDMLNVYRAFFDLPLLKDEDVLEYVAIYKPIHGLECSLPWYSWHELYMGFTSEHPEYEECDVTLTVSDVDPALIKNRNFPAPPNEYVDGGGDGMGDDDAPSDLIDLLEDGRPQVF